MQILAFKRSKYQIKGVIVHRGKTLSGGHYIAYIREGAEWIKWDDEFGTFVTWDTVKSEKAYILLFEVLDMASESQTINEDVGNSSPSRSIEVVRQMKVINEQEVSASNCKQTGTRRVGL